LNLAAHTPDFRFWPNFRDVPVGQAREPRGFQEPDRDSFKLLKEMRSALRCRWKAVMIRITISISDVLEG
jgi:hypothetical protein